jgi:hypothetical protein
MSESDRTNDWAAVQAALTRVGEHLKKPARLVLIGSTVGMWYGQPGRMTEDVDVWSPKSQVDLADIRQACEKAGVVFDPKGEDITGIGLYIQMVTPGVVHVGKWKAEERMFTTGKLEVVHPPAENIVACKLVRAEPHDIDDIVFLISRLNVDMERVRAAVATLSGSARERAEENMVYLDLRAAAIDGANRFLGRTAGTAEKAENASGPKVRRPKP